MSSNNTIFDDVFRTMVEKMPRLVIPLINEVFHTDYPPDVKLEQLRNEHQEENGEEITDSCLKIGKKLYHIECQSTDDTTMAVRMIEYDFYIAVENSERNGRRYRIEFPRSCVLFLRSSVNTPDYLEAEVVFADETTHLYRIPTVKMDDYTKDAIFEKNLLMLLPFYIMRYEKQADEFDTVPERLHILLAEYEEIRVRLEKELEGETTGLYTDLIKLITKIADYIFRKDKKVRKELGEIMGGKVLELESERLTAKGIQQGRTEGEKRLSILINRLILDGRSSQIQVIVNDKQEREKAYKEYHI
ncbi:MAG: hypothetical protein Q4C14_09070 [Bacillota bacterium]|nr:hypothetical protein [Bacillota bacterium]